MKTTVNEREENSVVLDVEVSGDEVQEGIEAAIRQLSREIRIPGFRKGKVPRQVVIQRLGMDGVVHQMLDQKLTEWYQAALAETGVKPVDKPDVDFEAPPEAGKPFSFQAKVTVMPTPVLGEYKGIEVPKDDATVADEEVDRQVERLREEFAELRVVEGRAAQEGDFVTIDFEGALEGEQVEQASATDYVLELGANQLLPDLEQGVIGMTAGEQKTIPVGFPEDYHAEDLQGKTVDFAVTLKEIKEKVLPQVNDDFAKDVSEFETLLELRLDIRKKLQGMKDSTVERRFRSLAVKQAADNATVEIPAVVVDERAREMVEDFAHSLIHQGTNFGTYMQMTGQSVEQMLADIRPQAEDTVRQTLVLEAIAQAEGLEVPDEELEERVNQMAMAGRVEPAEFRSRLEESGRMQSVRQQLLRDKAADVIAEHAVPVAPPEESETPEPEAPVEEGAEGEAERTTQ